MDLKDKKAFVTGGSGDIGGAIARALAAAGADVAISYLGQVDRASAIVEAIQAAGSRSLAVQLDQRDPSAIEVAARRLSEGFGEVEILVNNAAWNIGISFSDLNQLNAEIWDRVLETNLRGPYLLARALAPQLSVHGTGRIINIASVGGIFPGSSSIAYSASKAGLIHLTRCLAVALAPQVTVNCIAPGLVEETRMGKRLPDEIVQSVKNQVVLGRTASAQDIARQVITYCQADSVTGQLMVIDGGMPGCMC